MNPLRRLAGQTAIYGIPSILGRFLNYLLVPLYTYGLLTPQEYGVVNVFYSYTALLMVILTYGMETAFFRFSESEQNKRRVYSTGFISLVFTTLVFLTVIHLFSDTIARWISYPRFPRYIIWFGWIMALDTLSAIPFARLRAANKPGRVAVIKSLNIFVNIFFNIFFLVLCPWFIKTGNSDGLQEIVSLVYRPDWTIEYIFIANLIASLVTLVLLLPQIRDIRWIFDTSLWGRMIIYSIPLMIAGMAGIINESVDRILLRYLLPGSAEEAEAQVGIYSACYKIAVLMVLFIQAYRYAAEPFFFAQMKNTDAKLLYTKVMDYFLAAVSAIFLVTVLFLDTVFIRFTGEDFRGAREVIPVLMMAKLFLGVYYNVSIWFKITGKTYWGAIIMTGGALLTIGLNLILIPLPEDYWIHGYYGSAWATLACYAFMLVAGYLSGRKYYPVPYRVWKFFLYPGLALALYLISLLIPQKPYYISFTASLFLLMLFLAMVLSVEGYRSAKVGKQGF